MEGRCEGQSQPAAITGKPHANVGVTISSNTSKLWSKAFKSQLAMVTHHCFTRAIFTLCKMLGWHIGRQNRFHEKW